MLLTKPACLKGNGITWQIIQMRGSPYLCNIKWVKEKPLSLAQRALHISLIKHQQEDTQMRERAHTHTLPLKRSRVSIWGSLRRQTRWFEIKLQMVSVRKERKRTKGKRDNVSTFMEYKLWLKLSGAKATSISFLALKLTEDDFDFHWDCAVGEKADFVETAGLYLSLELSFGWLFKDSDLSRQYQSSFESVHAIAIWKRTSLPAKIKSNDFI